MHHNINKYFLYYPATIARCQYPSRYLSEYKKTQWSNSQDLEKIQIQKLIRLLSYSRKYVKFYKHVFSGVDLSTIKTLDDIQRIPFLSKEQLKDHKSELKSEKKIRSYSKTTGGSTGNPVTVLQNPQAIAAADAAYWRGYEWAGAGVCYKQGRFWGIPKGKRDLLTAKIKDFISNRVRFSAFSFNEHDMALYFKQLLNFKPQFLYGYVSMLEVFAKFMIANKLSFDFRLNCVITTSEVLTNPHRQLFKKAFNCNIFNEYGCGEVGTIAHECEKGSMHINAENVIVEIVKDGERVAPGSSGDIVVTDLNNYAMPLIRYNLKDIGYLEDSQCSCGRGLPILGNVAGRAYDTICNREGEAFHGEYFMYIFEDIEKNGCDVKGFQVIQKSFEQFTIKIIVNDRHRRFIESFITERVHKTYGEYATINFKYVSQIDRERSGKIRLIKSMLKKNMFESSDT